MSCTKLEFEGSMDPQSGGSGEEGSSEGKAPSEFLAECLSALLRRRYGAALRYCRLILRHEPSHGAARALLPTLRLRAATTARHYQEDDTAAEQFADSSASATDSLSSSGSAELSRSDSHRSGCRVSHSHRCCSEPHSEDAASDYVSELDLESEIEDLPLEDLDAYASTSASNSHLISDSSSGAECDDNGNCMSDTRNDKVLPLLPRDTRPTALDNDPRDPCRTINCEIPVHTKL